MAWFSNITYVIGIGLQYGDTIEYYEAARIFRAINFMSFAYQLIRYMNVSEMWGILIPVLNRMVSILLYIFIQLSLVVYATGWASYLAIKRSWVRLPVGVRLRNDPGRPSSTV